MIPGHVCKHANVKIRGLKTRAVVEDDSLGTDGIKKMQWRERICFALE